VIVRSDFARSGSNPAFRGLPARAEGVKKSDTCSAAVAARTKFRTANSGKILQTAAPGLPILLEVTLEITGMERDRSLRYLDILMWALFFLAVTLGLLPS
jgi:hypothetical protein